MDRFKLSRLETPCFQWAGLSAVASGLNGFQIESLHIYLSLIQDLKFSLQWWKKQTGQTPFIGILKWLLATGRGQ